jgi:hypothetical protein
MITHATRERNTPSDNKDEVVASEAELDEEDVDMSATTLEHVALLDSFVIAQQEARRATVLEEISLEATSREETGHYLMAAHRRPWSLCLQGGRKQPSHRSALALPSSRRHA